VSAHGAVVRVVLLAVCCVAASHAQQRVRPSVRLDYTAMPRGSGLLDLGAGLAVPAGTYVRVGLDAGVDLLARTARDRSARVDLLARYLLDPMRESPVGVSVGGGLTSRFARVGAPSYGVVLLAGAEFRQGARWRPAVELGLGRGVRAAVVLRRAPARRR
jgi:hypothetical protein